MANASAGTKRKLEYADRFGHTWSVAVRRRRGERECVVFSCDDIELVATPQDGVSLADLTPAAIKDLFCDAERVFVFQKQKWFVGYRARAGRGGVHAGICTQFRSDKGEIKNSKEMLLFRTMSEEALQRHLAST